MAARFNHLAIVKALLEQPDAKAGLKEVNAEGKTPLLMACCQTVGGVDVVSYLLDEGSDSTMTDLVREHWIAV